MVAALLPQKIVHDCTRARAERFAALRRLGSDQGLRHATGPTLPKQAPAHDRRRAVRGEAFGARAGRWQRRLPFATMPPIMGAVEYFVSDHGSVPRQCTSPTAVGSAVSGLRTY